MKRVITCSCGVAEEMPAGEPKDKAVAFAYSFRLDDYRCLTCGAKGVKVEVLKGKPEVRAPRVPRDPAVDTINRLTIALRESVKLQSHYAELLNMHDGGCRIGFKDPDAWIARLKETGLLK